MNIQETFLNLTSRTYPHGTEDEIFQLLPQDLEIDKHGNLFKKIGEPSTLFACHLDTATSALTEISHVISGDVIKTDGKSILGADDKAGVTIMLYMMENEVPGLYYFFLGEEVGCVGSKKLAEELTTKKIEGITKVISFDRRGTTSVITHQFGSRCCSDDFGKALSEEFNKYESTFNYKNDPTGLYTDSAQFIRIYPECTNISVGYWSEHTFGESQNIKHLEKLANVCLKVDWENLPIKRDPSKVEYKSYDYYDDYHSSSGYTTYGGGYKPVKPDMKIETHWFHDHKYFYWGFVNIQSYNGNINKLDLCKQRIDEEKVLINTLLLNLDVEYFDIEWDGLNLSVTYIDGHTTKCNRTELSEFIPELDFWKKLIEEQNDELYG